MTVRNIRNHQSRGLLPPPEVRARIGYYGQGHVDRLRLVREMQAEGFNLAAIQRLLGESEGAADRLLGVKRMVTMPFETESPEILTVDELIERFGQVDPKLLTKAVTAGAARRRSATAATRCPARRCCGQPRRCCSAASRCRRRCR